MNDLRPEARRLLSDARDADDPTSSDLDRVRRLALVNVLQPRARELLGALGALLEAAAAAQRGKHEGPSLPEIPSMLPLR